MPRRIERHLPLSQVHYVALLCLAEHPLHGYRLSQEISRRTAGKVAAGPASIHRTLRQLSEDGLIAETTERPTPRLDDARRRYYRTTEIGREVLAAESDRLANLVGQARASLLVDPQ